MKSITELHSIQERILKRLGYDQRKPFSEIRGDIESNKFAFHLKKLQEKNLIEKNEKGYKTTKKGREILPYFDLENVRHPVVVVDLLVFKGDKVYLKPKEEDPLDPFAGDYRAPSTRISKNNRLEETARELFKNEFDKDPENLKKSAVFDSEVRFLDGSEQHYLLFFFKTEVDEIDSGKEFFELSELDTVNILPGLEQVIRKIRWGDSLFMGEWDVNQNEDGFKADKLNL